MAAAALASGTHATVVSAHAPAVGNTEPALPPLLDLSEAGRFKELCLRIGRMNVDDRKVVPSAAYAHRTWMRDAYWTLGGLGDSVLMQYTWERFANLQDKLTGQVPTTIQHSDQMESMHDDESTALFMLLAVDVQRRGLPLWEEPLHLGAQFLRNRIDDAGRVHAGPGPYTWWLDTLSLGTRDTVTYSQGLTAVALRGAAELGLLPLSLAERAEAAYAGLYRSDLGTLPLSAHTTLLDVSCLVGEHLSFRYFGRPMLPTAVVESTLQRFHRANFPDGAFLGFKVATQLDGAHFPSEWLHVAPDNLPGYYHNGGSWLLYDALALDAARQHGIAEATPLLAARIRAETRYEDTLHEYLATTDSHGHLGRVPRDWRKDYAWNSYVGTLV